MAKEDIKRTLNEVKDTVENAVDQAEEKVAPLNDAMKEQGWSLNKRRFVFGAFIIVGIAIIGTVLGWFF